MRRSACLWMLLAATWLPLSGAAAERNDIPSCYAYAGMTPQQPAPSGRELVVVIDQTTPLGEDLRNTALKTALRYIRPDDNVLIYQFSAYLADSYMRLPFEGRMEAPVPADQRGDIGMDSMRKLDRCLQQQQTYFAKTFVDKFKVSLGTPDTHIARSEILFSLKQIAADLAKRSARERVVLLVSDLLENSDFDSFYAHNGLRVLDPGKEIGKVERQHLFADFGGAHVYAHGVGLVPDSSRNGYRSGIEIKALQQFWAAYFEKSHAVLEAFGAPSLTVDLQ
ncbi:hypothetical protein [Frateuria defendens]|uniref:hypothetical protein n=1 Tax=Frateuria defendens TaxID=2219559 RepID=UPI000AE4791B|nr:hypothetical protein [Frateuria defendens]